MGARWRDKAEGTRERRERKVAAIHQVHLHNTLLLKTGAAGARPRPGLGGCPGRAQGRPGTAPRRKPRLSLPHPDGLPSHGPHAAHGHRPDCQRPAGRTAGSSPHKLHTDGHTPWPHRPTGEGSPGACVGPDPSSAFATGAARLPTQSSGLSSLCAWHRPGRAHSGPQRRTVAPGRWTGRCAARTWA